jgi:predicted RND superfamily exporter protein
MYGPETRVGHDQREMRELFGDADTYVIMVPRGEEGRERAMIRELRDDERITSIISPESFMGMSLPSDMLPDDLTGQLRSENYDRLVLTVAVPPESEDAFDLVEHVQDVANKHFPGKYYMTGSGVVNNDLKHVVTGDRLRVNIIAVLAIFAVLVVTMRSIILPFILVMIIETAIWINMSISFITGSTLFYISYLIVSPIQLGATVDYAILFTQRYTENRKVLGLSPSESIVQTIKDNTVSILTSGLTLSVIGFLLSIFSSQGMIAQVGLLLGRGTLCSLAAVLFVLPGFLMLFDRFVIKDGTERPEVPDIQDIPDMLRKLSLKDSKEKGQ